MSMGKFSHGNAYSSRIGISMGKLTHASRSCREVRIRVPTSFCGLFQ